MLPVTGAMAEDHRATPSRRGSPPQPAVRMVPVASMRGDGQTQHRTAVNPMIVAEYAELMRAGVEFPPVRLWWDGADYWLTDGFQRLAAAKSVGLTQLAAEIRPGSLSEAQWDSYAANGAHGVRRTPEETQRVIRLALRHPNAATMSNVQIAKHLHIPEATLRRWRGRVSSPGDEDTARLVTRGATTYLLQTARIGRSGRARRSKSPSELRAELGSMKEACSTRVRRVLNVVGNWVFGGAPPAACLGALERLSAPWEAAPGSSEELSDHESAPPGTKPV